MADATEETSTDGYSPLLAQMLKIDPNKIGDVSLSALGRQAMGADSEAYKAAMLEVTAARDAMKAALENRKGRVDPSMLALAQGFLAPTRTGSFGESLGTAVGAYQQAQAKEEDRAAQLAKMRLELANAAVREEKEAATLGLNVASKLTPKLTNLQLQVQSEGLDPRSPKGIARILELQALAQATPEMKEFAARAGIPLTDATFAAQFRTYSANKPLVDVAARLGVDLNTPEGRQQAQQEVQRESFRRENPEVAKALASFGGDPLQQADRKRAEDIVSKNISLEQQSKSASIASSTASAAQAREQTKRIKQEIDEHVRTGNVAGIAESAQRAGIPFDPQNRYAGLNAKESAEKRTKDRDAADKYVAEKINPFIAGLDDDISNLRRAQSLNKEISTGITYGLGLGIGETAKLLSGDRAKINEFDSLSALSAKQNRIPGDSNVSNLDVQMMKLGTFSSDKEPSTNDIIIKYQLAQRERDRDFQNYMANYAAINGAITPHATAMWRRYLDANPITKRDDKGKIIINTNRVPYQQYFAAPRVQVDDKGREK